MTDETARLTADVVLLANPNNLHVLLIRRAKPPFDGCWALPGGHVDAGEEAQAAARRELAEETGLTTVNLEPVGVYSAPGRDPRGRCVTWAYVSLLDEQVTPTAGDDAREVCWCEVGAVLAEPGNVAFDHHRIIREAVEVMCTRMHYPAKSMAYRYGRELPGLAMLVCGQCSNPWPCPSATESAG